MQFTYYQGPRQGSFMRRLRINYGMAQKAYFRVNFPKVWWYGTVGMSILDSQSDETEMTRHPTEDRDREEMNPRPLKSSASASKRPRNCGEQRRFNFTFSVFSSAQHHISQMLLFEVHRIEIHRRTVWISLHLLFLLWATKKKLIRILVEGARRN